MSETDTHFSGSIPTLYDTLMVPMIFEVYAAHTAKLVASGSPKAVLETAAGTGAVTRALAPLLPADARYVITDLNQSMLDYAINRADQASNDSRRLQWQQADALALPFDDATFDAVFCQFGAMFFPSRPAGFAEARRVLKPGGRFIFSVWDRIEANEFANEVTNALAEVFPQDPPRFLARTPHGYHDLAQIREDLRQAGFADDEDVVMETITEQSHAPSAADAAFAMCQGSPLRNEIEARDASLLQQATDRAAAAIASRHGQSGPVAGKIQAHLIVAKKK